ncbi:MAG: hypothetical protein N2506_03800 [Dehalococcoidales bacterium]|nr:hypothetical protein [Dehalococcoidales bacterium]
MHHTLRLYAVNRPFILRLYIILGGLTRVPLLGRMVRSIANAFGDRWHHAYLLTREEAERLIAIAGGLALTPCACRKTFRKCAHPLNTEILIGPGRHILSHAGHSREITRGEALDIINESHRRGLVLTILRCHGDFYAICSCCSCCCVPLRLSRRYGIGRAVMRHKDIVAEYEEVQRNHARG